LKKLIKQQGRQILTMRQIAGELCSELKEVERQEMNAHVEFISINLVINPTIGAFM